MFAFALWDRYERKLVLCRDRVGKKPLYYGWLGDSFVFASELRALRAHPGFAAQVDRGALSQLLRCGWIEIGRAHVCTPVTNAHLVCRLLLEKKKNYN